MTSSLGGRVERVPLDPGSLAVCVWHPNENNQAVAYDILIVGWRGRHVNAVRLWSARAVDPMRLDVFNKGEHVAALSEQARAEAISKVLYPGDDTPAGQELRLRQEYFFVSASLQDIVHRHLCTDGNIHFLPDQAAVQLNDTHPSIAGPRADATLDGSPRTARGTRLGDLRRDVILHQPYALARSARELVADAIRAHVTAALARSFIASTSSTCGLHGEKFDAGDMLPAAVSLIDERGSRRVRMGHLAFVGSHRVNGVSALHTDLMRQTVFRQLHELYPRPHRQQDQRHHLPALAHAGQSRFVKLLCESAVQPCWTIKPRWFGSLTTLTTPRCKNASAPSSARTRLRSRELIYERMELRVDPDALFDVQIKRIHEYKRQLLNLLETIALYAEMRAQPNRSWVPRVKIFAGKAAANYVQAKLIIKLANDVAKVVNNDPAVRNILKIIFIPNYNVSLAETIIPAAELSEQISTAGMEASGTGNMKLALNGALTIGTLDGANIEIRDHVGADNIFIFGLKAYEVEERRRTGLDATATIASLPLLAEAVNALESGLFADDDRARFSPLASALRYHDYYMITADFEAYYEAQRRVDRLRQSRSAWARMSILNVANMGWFSSDRTIREYARDIWNVPIERPA